MQLVHNLLTEKNIFNTVSFTQLFIGTDQAYKMMKDLNVEWMLDYMTPANPSDAALAIVKGGAQRWQRLYYPYLQTKPMELLYNIIPQTLSSLNRRVFEK